MNQTAEAPVLMKTVTRRFGDRTQCNRSSDRAMTDGGHAEKTERRDCLDFLIDGWNDSLFDLPLSLTRAEVLSRLGTPEKSGKKSHDPILGDKGAWDRFTVPQGAIHIQYQCDGPGIARITLMRSDVVP